MLRVPGVTVFPAELTDTAATRDVIDALAPASIIHCAAATNVDWCEEHPQEAKMANAEASALLAEIAHKRKAQFVYISTDSVFDGKRGHYDEGDEPSPINRYAESKLLGENAVLRVHPTALIARVNIYGWNARNKQSLAEWILDRLRAGESVPAFTDVFFTPILVNDLSEQLLAMMKRSLTGIYHVAGSERVSKYEFARRVAACFELNPAKVHPSQVAEASLRAPRPPDVSLDTEKVSAALGHAMPGVDEGLSRFRALQKCGYVNELKSYLDGGAK
jgi:dTDP-4-dehydrorhamnose reductase